MNNLQDKIEEAERTVRVYEHRLSDKSLTVQEYEQTKAGWKYAVEYLEELRRKKLEGIHNER